MRINQFASHSNPLIIYFSEQPFHIIIIFPPIANQMHDYVKAMDDELGELASNCGLAFGLSTMLNCFIDKIRFRAKETWIYLSVWKSCGLNKK